MTRARRAFWITLTVCGAFLALTVIVDSVLGLGQRLHRIHPAAAIGFYIASGLAALLLVVRPICQVLLAPPLAETETPGGTETYDAKKLGRLAKRLLARGGLEPGLRAELRVAFLDGADLTGILDRIIEGQRAKANEHIKEAAVIAFVSTAISQNGRLDAVILLATNLRLIKQLVLNFGYRPTGPQLWRLYATVLITALLGAELDDLQLEQLVPQLAGILGQIPLLSVFASSVTQGVGSAFLTLRVGCLTRKYLVTAAKDFDRAAARRQATREAAGMLIPVVMEAGGKLPGGAMEALRRVMG